MKVLVKVYKRQKLRLDKYVEARLSDGIDKIVAAPSSLKKRNQQLKIKRQERKATKSTHKQKCILERKAEDNRRDMLRKLVANPGRYKLNGDGTVSVRSYTKSNGTQVKSHIRKK